MYIAGHSANPLDRLRDGGEGNRTPDLLNAIQALSQLSYTPGIFPSDFDVRRGTAKDIRG